MKDKAEIAEVFMSSVRQRIIQYLLVHEKGTVKEIKKELPDVPSASLYHHIKILNDSAFKDLWMLTTLVSLPVDL